MATNWVLFSLLWLPLCQSSLINFSASHLEFLDKEYVLVNCNLVMFDNQMQRILVNRTFDCSPSPLLERFEVTLNGSLSYPLVILISVNDGVNKIYEGYTSHSYIDNLPATSRNQISYQGLSMTYNMSLDCGSHMYGRHCNISCVPPTETDHYRCTRDGKVCNKGWLAPDCLVPNCKNNCGKHGTCISPGVCECEKGWFGQSCSQCEKKPGCKNGYCEGTPGTCKCEIGYRGMFCDRHISSECNLEHCVNGKCAFIDRTKVCYCNPGFHGKFCNETIVSLSEAQKNTFTPSQPSSTNWDTVIIVLTSSLLILMCLLVLKKLLEYNSMLVTMKTSQASESLPSGHSLISDYNSERKAPPPYQDDLIKV